MGSDDLIPDASKWVDKIVAGVAVMRRVYPFLGLVWIGVALTVAGSLTLAPDVLHHVLGLPVSIKVLDYRSVWLASGVVGLFYSVWLLGGLIARQADRIRRQAKVDSDSWKNENERLRTDASNFAARAEVAERALAARKPTSNVLVRQIPSSIGIIREIRITYQHKPSLYRCECDVDFQEIAGASPVRVSPAILALTGPGGQPEFAILAAPTPLPLGDGPVTYKGEAPGGALLRRHMTMSKELEGSLPVEVRVADPHRGRHQKSNVKLDFELIGDLVPELASIACHRMNVHVTADPFQWPDDLNAADKSRKP